MHCITERIAAMSYPADGIESAFKNHIDDISATIESKHSNKVINHNAIAYYVIYLYFSMLSFYFSYIIWPFINFST